MHTEQKHLANWGNFPQVPNATEVVPRTREEAGAAVRTHPGILARGSGRCYGDAALAPVVLSTRAWRRVLHFDEKSGTIDCESGVLLEEIAEMIVPRGWFFAVTPGIKSITVGGAIASDVHGKNHHHQGCFSRFLIDFDLLLPSSEVLRCSKTENADLFWKTCGGMGLTGTILRASFQLMPIASARMEQETIRCADLSELFAVLAAKHGSPYLAAWSDLAHPTGRGVVFAARHLESRQAEERDGLFFEKKKRLNVPFFAPSFLLNNATMDAYNRFFYWKNKNNTRKVSLDAYFYPLDSIGHWNRLYGRAGFVQYQCLIAPDLAHLTFEKLRQTILSTTFRPFLTVIKKHGLRPIEAIHSFPDAGFSLAMDFKNRVGIRELVAKLDSIVLEAGGKIYLTKDSLSCKELSGLSADFLSASATDSLQKKRLLKG